MNLPLFSRFRTAMLLVVWCISIHVSTRDVQGLNLEKESLFLSYVAEELGKGFAACSIELVSKMSTTN